MCRMPSLENSADVGGEYRRKLPKLQPGCTREDMWDVLGTIRDNDFGKAFLLVDRLGFCTRVRTTQILASARYRGDAFSGIEIASHPEAEEALVFVPKEQLCILADDNRAHTQSEHSYAVLSHSLLTSWNLLQGAKALLVHATQEQSVIFEEIVRMTQRAEDLLRDLDDVHAVCDATIYEHALGGKVPISVPLVAEYYHPFAAAEPLLAQEAQRLHTRVLGLASREKNGILDRVGTAITFCERTLHAFLRLLSRGRSQRPPSASGGNESST